MALDVTKYDYGSIAKRQLFIAITILLLFVGTYFVVVVTKSEYSTGAFFIVFLGSPFIGAAASFTSLIFIALKLFQNITFKGVQHLVYSVVASGIFGVWLYALPHMV